MQTIRQEIHGGGGGGAAWLHPGSARPSLKLHLSLKAMAQQYSSTVYALLLPGVHAVKQMLLSCQEAQWKSVLNR